MKLVLVSVVAALCVVGAYGGGIVGCYYGQWSNERPGLGNFGVSDLPITLCTHIYYSFVGLSPEGEITLPTEEEVDGKRNYISDFIALKQINPDVKLFLAIGGWNEASANFSAVSNDDTLRKVFVENMVTFLVENGFDGLDVDWEYPAQRDGIESDKESFIWLLQDLKKAFAEPDLGLSCAVAVTQSHIDLSYYVANISQIVDNINLMTYDYHGSWDGVTGVNSPLYPQDTDDASNILNVNASVNVWINNGADRSKLVLGMGTYGRTFTLASLDDVSTGAPATGAGVAGDYTQEAGIMAYYEICLSQRKNKWNVKTVKNNYVYGNYGTLWAGYDNAKTIYAKARYARKNGLGGVMVWAADLDDFGGVCGKKYPLIKAARKGFFGSPCTFHK